MALCISWRAPVRMNTASSVETVITGRTMLKVFMAVVLSTNCMPNILWLKKGRFPVRTENRLTTPRLQVGGGKAYGGE
jgi:hypothetical protein